MVKSPLYEVEARIVKATEKALLLDIGEDKPIWIPKSSCEYTPLKGNLVLVTMEQSTAEDKGFV